MSISHVANGPLFDGQLPRQILVQSNGHVWAITFTVGGGVLNLRKSTDSGKTFDINTTFDADVGDAFIAEDADGRLWRVSFWYSPEQWLLERSTSSGSDWTVIGSSPSFDSYVPGPEDYYDNCLSGLACHPTDSDKLAFGGGSVLYDGTYVYGACPVWTVSDGATIVQHIMPMTDYDLSGLATNDVLFTPDGRLLVSYSYFQATGSTRPVSVAYSDDLASFTEVMVLPEYNLDDFGWYEHLYLDADGNIYCAFGRDVPTVGEHCWMWDLDGNCSANRILYERGLFIAKSEDGTSWSLVGDWHVPESAESGFDVRVEDASPGYLYQEFVPGSNISGILHDGTLLHVWFRPWEAIPGPLDAGLSIYWTYDGSSWTEQPMFGPDENAAVTIGGVSNRGRITA